MAKLSPWITVGLLLAVGVESLLFQGPIGQIVARGLVVTAILFSYFSGKTRKGDAIPKGASQAFSVEALSLVSLIGAGAMMLLVFMTPPGPYRNYGLLAATAISGIAFILSEIISNRRAPKVEANL